MSQAGETFFTVVGCMDGRCQAVLAEFGKNQFGAEFPDTITEAGIVGLLANDEVSQDLLDSVKKKLLISLEKHHSKGIIVSGHEECAGNPVDKTTHLADIRKSVKKIQELIENKVYVVGSYVKRDGESLSWQVEQV